MRHYSRPYLGIGPNGERETFRALEPPTRETHGSRYAAVVGPFRTRRAAEWMRVYGQGNPHCRTVAEAERLARRYPVIRCAVCGEEGPERGSFRGHVHRWGPVAHRFQARPTP